MAHAKNHDYHILKPSIWPLLGAVGAFVMLFGAVLFMKGITPWMFLIGLVLVLYVMFGWWSDVVHEGNTGDHTAVVRIGLRYGFILFIMSEVMFFSAWFWTFFKHALYPMGPNSPAVDGVWPPAGITPFDPWHLPLLNTLILLTSGTTVTWAHHAIQTGDKKGAVQGLALTVILIHRVGRAFDGHGTFADALLVVVWLQLLMLALQVLQLIATLVAPPFAGIIGLAGFAVFLWLMTAFIAELHGFRSRARVFLGLVLTGLGTGFVLGIAIVLILGPEAFADV